jgi:hypothetical protein
METRRSFYLASQHDDFAELPIDTDRLNAINASNLPYNMPANDNVRTKERLSARCGNLLSRLMALHGLRSSD